MLLFLVFDAISFFLLYSFFLHYSLHIFFLHSFPTRRSSDLNRIKLLEEILSFRMQGVEFDNGDMYVDGHITIIELRSEERFSRNAETELVCRLLLEKKKYRNYIPSSGLKK